MMSPQHRLHRTLIRRRSQLITLLLEKGGGVHIGMSLLRVPKPEAVEILVYKIPSDTVEVTDKKKNGHMGVYEELCLETMPF